MSQNRNSASFPVFVDPLTAAASLSARGYNRVVLVGLQFDVGGNGIDLLKVSLMLHSSFTDALFRNLVL